MNPTAANPASGVVGKRSQSYVSFPICYGERVITRKANNTRIMPSPQNENGVIPWTSKGITPHTRHYSEPGIKSEFMLRDRQAASVSFHGLGVKITIMPSSA